MAAVYPGAVPDFTGEVGAGTDPLDAPDHATHHQDVADELVAIATELGVDPAGAAATVAARIAALETGGGGPSAASFAWVNQGDSTATDTTTGVFLEGTSTGASLRIIEQSLSGATWSVVAKILPALYHRSGTTSTTPSNAMGGIVLRDSVGLKAQTFNFVASSKLTISNWNSPTSWNSDVLAISQTPVALLPYRWLRIRQDATTRFFEYSPDGEAWVVYHSVAAGNFVAPDKAGVMVNHDNGLTGFRSGLLLESFSIT